METVSTANRLQSQKLGKMEHDRSYASNQAAIAALELATALSTVLTRRLGQGFADELCAELQQRARALQTDDFASKCTSSIVSELAAWPIWTAALNTADDTIVGGLDTDTRPQGS